MRPDGKSLKSGVRRSPNGSLPQKCWRFIHCWTISRSQTGQNPPNPGISAEDKLRNLEAVLFLTPQGVSSRKASKLAGLADATEVRTLIRQLNLLYDNQGRPYRVEEVAGGYAILTRPQFAPWLRKLSHVPGELRLGQSSLETLAIVAYRQPVVRADIEAIRGVGCSEILKQLMEMDLVRISGRSEDLGRPYLYGTTQRFLQMFGLRSADRLPRIEWVNSIPPNEFTSTEDQASESEVKESTVKKSMLATALLAEEIVDERILKLTNVPVIEARDEDDDEDWEDDEDSDDDDDDDEEDFDDWEEDEEDVDDDAEEEEEEEGDLEEESDEEWEEVDDEDEEELDEEEEEDDDWEEDDDDDWDDDEEDEDDDDEDWE
ncbi:MAG: SMC-Scp complex subunit ScpB [Pirellulales bacterium]